MILRGYHKAAYLPPFAVRAMAVTPLVAAGPRWTIPNRLSYDTRKVQDALAVRLKRLQLLSVIAGGNPPVPCVA